MSDAGASGGRSSATTAITATAEAPRRTHVCLDCRSLLLPGEACDLGRGSRQAHRVVPLALAEGRELLVREVWGPPSLRRQAKAIARAGAGGAGAGWLGNCAG